MDCAHNSTTCVRLVQPLQTAMKLFKCPVLVFDNIVKQLEPVSLVSLSFCSKKTRERIKRVSFSIKDVCFSNEHDGKRGYAFEVDFPQHSLFVSFQSLSREFKKISVSFTVLIGDIAYDCRYLVEGRSIYLGCIGYEKTSIFINYILNLVRAEITEIRIDLNKLVDIKQFISEPCFENAKGILLAGESVPAKKVTELYDCFKKPVLQTYVKSHIRSLSPTSKLLQSENLGFDEATYISTEHLLNFNGKYINLECSSLQEEDIVTFIKHWLDGNYPNLEGAYITTQEGSVFETEKVLNEFNTIRWNPAERAQNFMYKDSLFRNKNNEFPMKDCSNGHDLERSDGLLATMQFGELKYNFNFYVWHTRFPS